MDKSKMYKSFLLAGLCLFFSGLLIACQAVSNKTRLVNQPTDVSTPVLTVSAEFLEGLPVQSETPQPPVLTDSLLVAPKDEKPDLSPEELARQHLAIQLQVPLDQVEVVSVNDWTNEPETCELAEVDDRLVRLLVGERKEIIVSYKEKNYTYWVFRSVAGIQMAFPCTENR